MALQKKRHFKFEFNGDDHLFFSDAQRGEKEITSRPVFLRVNCCCFRGIQIKRSVTLSAGKIGKLKLSFVKQKRR